MFLFSLFPGIYTLLSLPQNAFLREDSLGSDSFLYYVKLGREMLLVLQCLLPLMPKTHDAVSSYWLLPWHASGQS